MMDSTSSEGFQKASNSGSSSLTSPSNANNRDAENMAVVESSPQKQISDPSALIAAVFHQFNIASI
ncbi:unnamed protein product [Anisakis simplex]|uniref:Ovule protein n=1 Tax=Anisakis simplex TaxID=6269 RepID=A0A0M3KI43_ANISI|nr:unnamed protein product [Anisakis simplex]